MVLKRYQLRSRLRSIGKEDSVQHEWLDLQIVTGPATFFTRTWSVPKLFLQPSCLRHAVIRLVPAKISIMMHCSNGQPLMLPNLPRHFFASFPSDASCSCSGCGAWHPLRVHKCQPFGHCAPCAALSQRLNWNAKQSLRLC